MEGKIVAILKIYSEISRLQQERDSTVDQICDSKSKEIDSRIESLQSMLKDIMNFTSVS